MKRRLTASTGASVLCSLLLLLSPLGTAADEPASPSGQELSPEVLAQAVITEVQTGNAARADEFVEIYNATDGPLDLTGWQLRYITASESSVKTVEDPSSVIALVPPVVDGATSLVPAGGYYLLHSGVVVLPEGVLGQQYEASLPATGGSLVLVSPDNQACEFIVEDALAWGTTTHMFGEGEALVSGASSSKDRLFSRYVDADSNYVESAENAADFAAADAATASGIASPGADGSQVVPDTPGPGSGALSQLFPVRFVNPDCTVPEPPGEPPVESPPSTTIPPEGSEEEQEEESLPVIPAGNIGLKPPQISELLPNPASPQTDADDEFVELYNPNDRPFDLGGYVIEVGLATKRRYTIPAGNLVEPRSFRAFFSADTGLALSNSGSQVFLVDPLGTVLVQGEPYGTAKDGQAWLLANGKWQWTTRPTPNALNVVSAPVVRAAGTSKKSAKKTAGAGSAASKSKAEGSQQDDPVSLAATTATSRTPLHPGVLALIAASALLYGAYEYRRDVANRIYQFRSNRAARAAARQSAKGG